MLPIFQQNQWAGCSLCNQTDPGLILVLTPAGSISLGKFLYPSREDDANLGPPHKAIQAVYYTNPNVTNCCSQHVIFMARHGRPMFWG